MHYHGWYYNLNRKIKRNNHNHVRSDGFQTVATQAQSPDRLERVKRLQSQKIVVRVHGAHPIERSTAVETFAFHVQVSTAWNVQKSFRRARSDRHVSGRECRADATFINASTILDREKDTGLSKQFWSTWQYIFPSKSCAHTHASRSTPFTAVLKKQWAKTMLRLTDDYNLYGFYLYEYMTKYSWIPLNIHSLDLLLGIKTMCL